MNSDNHQPRYKAVVSHKLDKILKKQKRKNPRVALEIEKQISKIINFPEIGKPLRYDMKHRRRIHIGSFVLIYEIWTDKILFLDFEHHDKVYKAKL